MPTLRDIVYPVYRLKTEVKTVDNITTNRRGKVLDNKNLGGDSLAKRRLRYEGCELAKLGHTIFSMAGIYKFGSGTKFIDSNGIIFSITKNKYYHINYSEVLEVKYTDSQYTNYIRCKGINKWIKYSNIVSPRLGQYVGIVEFRGGYLVYDVSNYNLGRFRRML